MIGISSAIPEDLERILALDRLVLGAPRFTVYSAESIAAGQCLIARVDGAWAGYAAYDRHFFGRFMIGLVMVDPQFRRMGVATALVRRVEATVPVREIFTSTNASNTPMRRLLGALGYAESGRIEHLDPGDPEIIYYKRL